MNIDIGSFMAGGTVVFLIALIGLFALLGLIFGKMKTQLKYILTKLYSRTSLMLIAMFDVAAMFDPSQVVLGLGIGPIAGLTVFFSEWGLHDKFKKGRFFGSLIEGFIAAIIVMIPLPIAGMFVAWFGVLGDKKKK